MAKNQSKFRIFKNHIPWILETPNKDWIIFSSFDLAIKKFNENLTFYQPTKNFWQRLIERKKIHGLR